MLFIALCPGDLLLGLRVPAFAAHGSPEGLLDRPRPDRVLSDVEDLAPWSARQEAEPEDRTAREPARLFSTPSRTLGRKEPS